MKRQKDHVATLRRRERRLKEMVDDWEGRPGGDSWARAELAAIRFALGCVIELHPDLAEVREKEKAA